MAEEERRVVPFLLAVVLVCGTSCLVASDEGPGNLECEDLPTEDCAFSVSSSGARCVLERGADNELQCQTSFIMAERRIEWIETSECIKACGVERMTLGMSTDSLTDMAFLKSLCSHQCNHNCHNIFDLYTSLAAGDGLYLPRICRSRAIRSQRMKVDLPYPTTVARLPPRTEEEEEEEAPSLASQADNDYYYYEQEPGYVEAEAPSPSSYAEGVLPAELPDYYYHGEEEEPPPPAEPPEPSESPHSYDEYSYYPTALPPSTVEPEESVDGYDHQDSDFEYMEPWY